VAGAHLQGVQWRDHLAVLVPLRLLLLLLLLLVMLALLQPMVL